MPSSASIIPGGMLSRTIAPSRTIVQTCPRRCYASKPGGAKKPKHIVLEKPAKFNPPSHGSKLPNKSGPRHYGGALSDMEMKAQARKDYPGLPPPSNSFGHWFWSNPKVHAWISIVRLIIIILGPFAPPGSSSVLMRYTLYQGTLGSLAAYSLSRRFLENSPYGDLMPSFYEWLRHPILSAQTFGQMIVLHIDYNTAQSVESRRSSLEDITKRRKYMRAHDLEEENFAKSFLPEKFIKSSEDAMEKAFGEGEDKKDGKEAEENQPEEKKKKGWGVF
ncbi:hypothetical protein MKZ38_010267 [Zalerion maritima]|uniref:Uncharacterized protein n=1 Tax=Zalerion maritima TaxID=339359 RepID=A0AAD5RJL3_9PEZI|nr:hypothetical protein MKZ38_010267 [Zalerion maritima]